MEGVDETLTSLVGKVAANCDEIGSYIRNTEYIVKNYDGKIVVNIYDSSNPLEYLQEWRGIKSWDDFFSYIMDLWDEDKMSAMRFNASIERLSAPAARLDILMPKFEKECQKYPNKPESVTRNAREMVL